MYVFDTNVFNTLGNYYPRRFPTLWDRINDLTFNEQIISVREVRNELELYCPFDHIYSWIQSNRHIFLIPTPEECRVVATIFLKDEYKGLIRRKSINRASPVADPFIIAVAQVRGGTVVTQESYRAGGARIPTVCEHYKVQCINLEAFFEEQDILF